uniref:Hemocyanin subunit A n=1 Tax=Scutigera coleoptrata TaxID=29022 RepID=HCYA_SCUCO|nr:RecName: Full=Hemocyanin subunit A; Flags: Precursor [Scutigera coleoptrata]CAC69246.1 hemocyanin subunit A [Scutigera coleoptrata]
MWSLALATLFVLGTVIRADQCPPVPADTKDKLEKILELIGHVNRPLTPETPEPAGYDETKLKGLGILPQHEIFSLFDERTWPEATKAAEFLMEATDFEHFIQRADVLRHRINEDMFMYALNVAVLHRKDTRGVQVPRIHKIYPDKFLKQDILVEVREKVNHGEEKPVVDATELHQNQLDPNYRLSYFLEDIGMNSHHYHWHVVHPAVWLPKHGPRKDRKGELFYYMHHQMVARYDSERLSNNLPRTEPFENWDDPLEEGYAPHLTIHKTGYNYMFRPEGLIVRDLPELNKNKMRQWKSRILHGIHLNVLYAENGTKISLDNEHGIDLLGDAIESSLLSVNRAFYGNIHCYAHVMAARIADPDGRYGEDNGVMHDVATSARDPLFYRWHKFIDNIFLEYKDNLDPYTQYELTWPDVVLNDVTVKPHKGDYDDEVHTYWEVDNYELGKGFDYTRKTTATVKVRHLQHEDYHYEIDIDNNAGKAKKAVFRIFLAPKYNEKGELFPVNEQRQLLVELDKFVATLEPGHNVIERQSKESSVTMSKDHVFGEIRNLADDHQCSCGWPDYLLLPKGKYEGMTYQLFVVATDYEEDHVEDAGEECQCRDSMSYCGSVEHKLPDNKPLGYPFDRRIDGTGFEEFKTQNMYYGDVVIQFTGETVTH